MRTRMGWSLVAALMALPACGPGGRSEPATGATHAAPRAGAPRTAPAEGAPDAWTAARAPEPTRRLDRSPPAELLALRVGSYFQGHVGRRIHIQLDKPLYQPGETLWIKTWDLKARDLAGASANRGIHYQLISPRGAVVLRKRVQERSGLATNDFALPASFVGGEYTLRVIAFDGQRAERPVILSRYEPPRIKKTLEFLRKAYGAGDEVSATIEVRRPTGEALAKHPLRAVIQVDGRALKPVALSTDETGAGLVRFKLPAAIQAGDGLLTVMVADGGITESISKRIPIVVKTLRVALYPEGGQLVTGLPARVYLAARTPLGKPADVEGQVRDDRGQVVARFRSVHHGLGRFALTPASGRSYAVEITRPVGITARFPVPAAAAAGCVLASYDDYDSVKPALVARVRCTSARRVVVAAVLREQLLDRAVVEVPADRPAVVHLRHADPSINQAQGVARVTLFDDQLAPLAERLVYRNRNQTLKVALKADRKAYRPREKVQVTVSTTDAWGKPQPAELALAVVDDTVLSLADDKTGHLLSRLYLEPELPGKVFEPNTYFDRKNAQAGQALDLLLGTRGWRRFDWRPVLHPPKALPTGSATVPGLGGRPHLVVVKQQKILVDAAPRGDVPQAAPRDAFKAVAKKGGLKVAKERLREQRKDDAAAGGQLNQPVRARAPRPNMAGEALDAPARFWRGRGRGWAQQNRWAYAPVRVFPVPEYQAGYAGPRTDFRETLYWAPTVRTGADGTARVSFPVSDAITSFRLVAEGVGGGLAGRQEAVIKSSLPFSMGVKIPVEVSAGDRLDLPLTLTNDTAAPLAVAVEATIGDLLRLEGASPRQTITLKANERRTLTYAVRVVGKKGQSPIAFTARAGNLTDEFRRTVTVEPLGFPQEISFAGELEGRARHTLQLAMAVPGTVEGSIRLYPSPVATMVGGLEGMLREPSGCFEQTSSSNYPNVMVMSYLKEAGVTDPRLTARVTGLMTRGYAKLAGYEAKSRGFEWFGRNPGHEALSAYGLVEFADMKKVYPAVDRKMVDRTVTWLMARRDGQGGFQRNGRALDTFGRASKAVTDGYIVYSLTEAGYHRLAPELRLQARVALGTQDAYLLALATNALMNVPARHAEGRAAAKRLAKLQDRSGAWLRANHSVTRSGGTNLHIETTSLAILALLKAGGHDAALRRAMTWLNKNRNGYGRWGATQATVLGLKAFTAYSRASRKLQHPGEVRLALAGRNIGRQAYAAGRREPLVFGDLGKRLRSGTTALVLQKRGKGKLPYSIAIAYRSTKPATSPKSVVALETSLARTSLKMGETTRLTALVRNKTAKGQPMTLVRVGLPGGLAFQTWQLKELRDKGLIAFYETRGREVILYLQQLKPSETRTLPIELVAVVPGAYTAPASSAYLYYTDEHKTWAAPVKVAITR